jgi:hypothetical protein
MKNNLTFILFLLFFTQCQTAKKATNNSDNNYRCSMTSSSCVPLDKSVFLADFTNKNSFAVYYARFAQYFAHLTE